MAAIHDMDEHSTGKLFANHNQNIKPMSIGVPMHERQSRLVSKNIQAKGYVLTTDVLPSKIRGRARLLPDIPEAILSNELKCYTSVLHERTRATSMRTEGMNKEAW